MMAFREATEKRLRLGKQLINGVLNHAKPWDLPLPKTVNAWRWSRGVDKYENIAVLGRWDYGYFFSKISGLLLLPLNSIIKSIKTDLFNREITLQGPGCKD